MYSLSASLHFQEMRARCVAGVSPLPHRSVSLLWSVGVEVDQEDSTPAALHRATPTEARQRPRDVGAAGAHLRGELGMGQGDLPAGVAVAAEAGEQTLIELAGAQLLHLRGERGQKLAEARQRRERQGRALGEEFAKHPAGEGEDGAGLTGDQVR